MIFNPSLMVFNIMMVSYTPTTYSSVHIFQSKNNNILFVLVYVSMALAGRGNITTFVVRHNGKGERSLLCCLDKYSLLLFDFSRRTPLAANFTTNLYIMTWLFKGYRYHPLTVMCYFDDHHSLPLYKASLAWNSWTGKDLEHRPTSFLPEHLTEWRLKKTTLYVLFSLLHQSMKNKKWKKFRHNIFV